MYQQNDMQVTLKMIKFFSCPFLCKTVVDVRIKIWFTFNQFNHSHSLMCDFHPPPPQYRENSENEMSYSAQFYLAVW